MTPMDSTQILIAFLACIPSAVVGLAIWFLQRRISKAEKAREERERIREKNELYIIETVGASLALGEATARAVQRIPDAHCNGDMHQALEYATKVKHDHKDFLHEQAIRNIY